MSDGTKECPYCAGLIKTKAQKCHHCGEFLEDVWPGPDVAAKGDKTVPKSRADLHQSVRPFRRCIHCNGTIHPADKAAVLDRLEPLTRRYFDEFYRCAVCGKVYWKGSHYEHMRRRIASITGSCVTRTRDSGG